jgi:hypothetical protein
MAWHIRKKPTTKTGVKTIKPTKAIKPIKPVKPIRPVKPIAPLGKQYYWRA